MKHASYLKHLKFNPSLRNSLQAKYLRNPRLLVLLLLLITTFGAYSYVNLPRRLNPEIKIPYVVVSDVLPGASASDVESLITDPLEDAVGGLQNIDTFVSTSRDSISVVQIQFKTGTDADKAASDVKTAVDAVSLPADAQKVNVIKVDFEKFPVWTFSIKSKSGDIASLLAFSKELKDSLESVSTIDEVNVTGLEEQEIQILIKPETMSTYNFNPQTLLSQLSSANKSFPAGTVTTDNSNFTLSINPAASSINDIRSTKINLNGTVVDLSDIATVSERSKPAQSQSYVAKVGEKPEQSITFSIFKTSNADISKTVKDAKKVTDSLVSKYGDEFQIFSVTDISDQIDEQFTELIRDFILTVFLVFIALFIFLGIRQAIVASISIPLTFLISFIIMGIFGISLSFISFFSLLLALGLLVDDTIVVISAMTSYHRSGKFNPEQTALLVWRDFITPILTTTLTTVWAFVPLLLSSGIIGEFIKPIPIVVSSTLLASFFVAMFITLPVITYFLKPQMPRRVKVLISGVLVFILFAILMIVSPKTPILLPEIIILSLMIIVLYKLSDLYKKRVSKIVSPTFKKYHNYFDQGIISFEGLSIKYQLFIRRILSSKKSLRTTIVLVVIFSIFSYFLVPIGFVKSEFFPKTDTEQLSISVELPPGTNITTSKREALIIFDKLQKTKTVKTISLDLGSTVGDFGGSASSGSNSFLYTLVLDKKDSSKVAEEVRREFKDYSKGKFSVNEESGGPPAGADVQINLSGTDLGTLDTIANNIMQFLEKVPGVTNVDKSIKPGTSKIVFVPDKAKLSAEGISADQIGGVLRTFASGFKVSSVKFDTSSNKDTDLTIRMSSEAKSVESIGSILIPTVNGKQIPLISLGYLKLESSPTLITHEDAKRTISVKATVKKGYSVQTVNTNLEQVAKTLNLPTGYSWKTGGVNEENQKSVNSIFVAMILSVLLILATMVLQFQSFRKALIVILVIPLSISGVFIIFALTNTPLSFPALVGVLALFGIVVKNSILIVDKIQANEKTVMNFTEGIAEGAASRLEPIALTSMTAILGLIPISLSSPLWRGLGGAIIAGLIFSGTIMLFFIPVVYYLVFKSSKKVRTRRSS